MKILVCFKVVKDVDYILKEDWNDIANNQSDLSYVKNIFNCYDEGALENALIFKNNLIEKNINVQLDAITTTELNCDLFNKLLLAAGYDKVINLKGKEDYFTPQQNAQIIYNYIKSENYDIVFTGFENAIGNNGIFPYKLASLLDFDVLNKVTNLNYTDKIIATVETETSILKYEFDKNAVLIFKNTENSAIRFPSLMDRLKAKNKPEIIEQIDNYNNNILEKDLKIISTYYKEEKLQTKFIDGNLNYIINEVEKEVQYE